MKFSCVVTKMFWKYFFQIRISWWTMRFNVKFKYLDSSVNSFTICPNLTFGLMGEGVTSFCKFSQTFFKKLFIRLTYNLQFKIAIHPCYFLIISSFFSLHFCTFLARNLISRNLILIIISSWISNNLVIRLGIHGQRRNYNFIFKLKMNWPT